MSKDFVRWMKKQRKEIVIKMKSIEKKLNEDERKVKKTWREVESKFVKSSVHQDELLPLVGAWAVIGSQLKEVKDGFWLCQDNENCQLKNLLQVFNDDLMKQTKSEENGKLRIMNEKRKKENS